MSTQLRSLGIQITEGYEAEQLESRPDCVVVGNVMTRGMPVVEAMLDQGLPFASGPEWLARHVLDGRTQKALAYRPGVPGVHQGAVGGALRRYAPGVGFHWPGPG